MWESQAWVGARKPPLAVDSVVGVLTPCWTDDGGWGAEPWRLLPPLTDVLLLRPPAVANSMSSFLRVFSRTLPSKAEDRLPDSFSLLLDTEDEPLDSVEAFRRSLGPLPLVIVVVFAIGLVCGELLRLAGDGFLTGEGFLIGDSCLGVGTVFSGGFGAVLSFFLFGATVGPLGLLGPVPPPVAARRSLTRPGDSNALPATSPLLGPTGVLAPFISAAGRGSVAPVVDDSSLSPAPSP